MPTVPLGGRTDDAAMQSKLGYVTIPYNALATVGDASLGNGTPALAELGTTAAEQAGIVMTTADEVYGYLDFPWNRDPQRDLLGQLLFEVEEANKAEIDWGIWIKGLAAGEAFSDAKVASDKNIAFAAAANTVAGELVVTETKPFLLAAGRTNELIGDEGLQFCVELIDVGTATADKVRLFAVRFWYTLQFSHPGGVRRAT